METFVKPDHVVKKLASYNVCKENFLLLTNLLISSPKLLFFKKQICINF